MELWAMLGRATQDGLVMVESSDKTQSTGGGNSNPLQYCCRENPINSMKRQTYMTPEDEPPRSEGVQYVTGEEWRAITSSSRRKEVAEPKQTWCSVVDVSGDESKVWSCKEQYCVGTWNVNSVNQVNWRWSSRKWQEWTSMSQESWTKMDRQGQI